MIDLGRVGNNALTIIILLGIGYMVYSQVKGQKGQRVIEKLKGMIGGGLKK